MFVRNVLNTRSRTTIFGGPKATEWNENTNKTALMVVDEC